MINLKDLIDSFKKNIKLSNFSNFEKEKINNALKISIDVHKNQSRKSGDPFLIHPLAVATNLWKKYNDIDLIISALLHDVVEDSEMDIKYLYDNFSQDIGFIVDSVTKNRITYYHNQNVVFNDKISKLLYGGIQNIKCIILKIADRENNLNTLGNLGNQKQIRMAFETQAIYYPLKNIIKYDLNSDIFISYKMLLEYLKNNNIKDYNELKISLYNKSFKNFDNDTYDLVYKNSDKIIWKIEDKELFMNFLKISEFNKHIHIISIEQIGDNQFRCSFLYSGGNVFDDESIKLHISSFKN